jgi:hypothetical protein
MQANSHLIVEDRGIGRLNGLIMKNEYALALSVHVMISHWAIDFQYGVYGVKFVHTRRWWLF